MKWPPIRPRQSSGAARWCAGRPPTLASIVRAPFAAYNEAIDFSIRWAVQVVMLAALSVGGAGCRASDFGLAPLDAAWTSGDAAAGPPDAVSPPDADFDDDSAVSADAVPLVPAPPPGVSGAPADVGCADGTREGFVDLTGWRSIAGCSGAWSIPGLLGPDSRVPQCNRAAGNSGANRSGRGCTVADLCANGWHVCEGANEVGRNSPTECESAVPPNYAAFFLVRRSATSYGLCLAGPEFANDLHGCGTFGASEDPSCQPLDRRLSFIDCLGSGGSWTCGNEDQHFEEANLVIKNDVNLGGVLCCRDP